MAKSRVVLATGDEWIGNLISAVLREAGVDVVLCANGPDAIAAAARSDVLLTDAALPDEPSWIASQIRALPGPASAIPVLMLAHADDTFSRSEGLRAGIDICLTKPFRADELGLQILSVIAMVHRFSERRSTSGASHKINSLRPMPTGAALSGDLAVVSLATVLSVLELERRSGIMDIQGPKQRATLTMREGSAVQATLAGSSTSIIAVLRRVLRWKTGRFEFSPDDRTPASAPPENHSIGALLIEAARLDDEAPSSQLIDSTHPPSYEEAEVISIASQRPPPAAEIEGPRSVRRPSMPPPSRKIASVPPPSRRGPMLSIPPQAELKPTPTIPLEEPPAKATPRPAGPPRPPPTAPPRPGSRPGPPRPRGSG